MLTLHLYESEAIELRERKRERAQWVDPVMQPSTMSEGDEQIDNGLSETPAYPFTGHRYIPFGLWEILRMRPLEQQDGFSWKQQQQTVAQVKWLLAKQLKTRSS